MNKALLKKLLSLSILGGLFFTGCEEDDEGFNNGDIVGQWEITYYYANRTRVVANPAGVSADTDYRFYFKWKDGDAFAAAAGVPAATVHAGSDVELFKVQDGDNILGYPQTLEYSTTSTPSLAQLGVAITLTLSDAPSKGQPADYLISGTYPSYVFDEDACNTAVSIAPITDAGLYTPNLDANGVEKLGNLIIEPDPTKGGNVLPPFPDGSFCVTAAGASDGRDESKIDYVDRNGHDERYKEVKSSWSEEDDRVIQGYGYAFTNDAGDLLASGAPYGNTAQPATSEGYVNINLLAKSAGQSTDVGTIWGGYQTWYFFNVMAAFKAQAFDIKAPLTDLDGDGSIGVGDMVAFMHADNLAGGGGKTAFGLPYTLLVDSSNPLQPVPVNDSTRDLDLSNLAAGGKMKYKVMGLCVPTNEIVTVKSKWSRIEE